MKESKDKLTLRDKLRDPLRWAMMVGLFLFMVGFSMNPKAMIHSYLYAYILCICLTLGCLGLTLLHHTVKGRWGLSILRILEAGSSANVFLVMGILFIPIALNLHDIYHWTHAEAVQNDTVLQYKSRFLNEKWFLIRTAIYFIIWGFLAYILRKSTIKEDQTRDNNEQAKRTNISAPGLVVFVLTVNFAFTDWTMSLDPHWFSSIYGVLYMVGQALMALAFGTFIITRNSNKFPYSEIVRPALTKDLGNMMLAFTMIWCYFTLSQFLIIWSGNIPEYTRYYIHRQEGVWVYLAAFIIIGQFAVPFLMLIAPRTKAVPQILMKLAAWIFVMRFVDIYMDIMPMLRKTPPQWTDFAALFFIGACWVMVFREELKRAAPLLQNDSRLMEVAEHHA